MQQMLMHQDLLAKKVDLANLKSDVDKMYQLSKQVQK